jgi:hypothetical protein
MARLLIFDYVLACYGNGYVTRVYPTKSFSPSSSIGEKAPMGLFSSPSFSWHSQAKAIKAMGKTLEETPPCDRRRLTCIHLFTPQLKNSLYSCISGYQRTGWLVFGCVTQIRPRPRLSKDPQSVEQAFKPYRNVTLWLFLGYSYIQVAV